jgi:hypothetical protein
MNRFAIKRGTDAGGLMKLKDMFGAMYVWCGSIITCAHISNLPPPRIPFIN